jgi:hypothetical protein
LQLLGIQDRSVRQSLLARLYDHLRQHFEKERRKEEEAIDNKRRTKGRQRQTPEVLAQAVFDLIHDQHPLLLRSYEDFTDSYGQATLDDARYVPKPDRMKLQDDLLGAGLFYRSQETGKPEIARAKHPTQAELMMEISLLGEGDGTYFLPSDADLCKKLASQLRAHREAREAKVRELLQDRTGDPELAEKALPLVLPRFRRYGRMEQ